MLRTRQRLIAVGVLLGVGCSEQQAPGTAAPADSQAVTAEAAPVDSAAWEADGAVPASCRNLHETILRTQPTRAALREEFGAADSLNSATEPNRHVPNAVDSLFTVHYPGLTMDIRTPQGGRDMATGVMVAHNRFLAFPGIGIGTPRSRLLQVLGEPTSEGDAAVTYDCAGEVEQPVTFHLRDGRVDRIEISYYVD